MDKKQFFVGLKADVRMQVVKLIVSLCILCVAIKRLSYVTLMPQEEAIIILVVLLSGLDVMKIAFEIKAIIYMYKISFADYVYIMKLVEKLKEEIVSLKVKRAFGTQEDAINKENIIYKLYERIQTLGEDYVVNKLPEYEKMKVVLNEIKTIKEGLP